MKKQEPNFEERLAVEKILQIAGEDVLREGIIETPKRYINFLKEFVNPEPFNLTTFDSENYDEIIIVKDIPFYSLCEHHIAPFFGKGSIGYLPNGRMAGISKLPRVLDMFARKLQNQERITNQVAEYLMEHLDARGVAVVLEARHMCMEMRGIKKPGASTTTSAMRGVFKNDSKARAEFLNLIK